MKKKTTKQMLLTVCAVALVLLTTVGTAFAYFSDHEEAQGGATLKLQGETTLHEEMDGNNKHIVIENTGEVDMIVRVAVFGTEVEGKTVIVDRDLLDQLPDQPFIVVRHLGGLIRQKGFELIQPLLEPCAIGFFDQQVLLLFP